jgi:2-iminobutanoate/2-iminopropanoate deaminase
MDHVATDGAPLAIGPYSQAVIAGGLVFCSGQVAMHPGTTDWAGGDAREQADRVLQNLSAVLAAAGSELSKVVKTTVYLKDMGDFATVNEVYARHFGEHRPARACVAVSELPKGGLVEIDAIALQP